MMKECLRMLAVMGIAVSGVGAYAADIAVYRAATGTELLTTADFDHTWDTTVRESSSVYSLNVNGSDIECASGHHLVLYNSRFDSTGGSNRSEAQTLIRLAGADLPIGWSQGYMRRSNGDDELITAGGGIIDVANAGDAVVLRSFRTDANSGAGVQREPNASAIQLLKLDDAWDYCRLSRGTDQAGPTDPTYIDVTYDVQDELDTGSFDHTSGTGDITLKTAGHYLVFANTHFQFGQSTDNRSNYKQQLTLDGAKLDGSLTTVYLRGNANGNSCSDGAAVIGKIIETTSATQILNVEVSMEAGGETPTILANRTALTIVKLPDTGDYIRLDDSGKDNFNPDTTTALGWDTEDEFDATGFTHSDSQIGAAVDDDYLFLSSLYDDNDGGSRVKWWQRWQVNGSDIKQWGHTGRYARDSGTDSQASGNGSGLLLAMTAGDYVAVVSERLGNSGTMEAVEKGVQGVRLGSIFSSGPVTIANQSSSGVTSTNATLNGLLLAETTNATVTVYWGTTDGTNNPLAWTDSAIVGTWTNVAATNISYDITGLSAGTEYFYTFRASYVSTNLWAEPSSSFTTVGTPAVTNAGGATDPYGTSAVLNGELTDGLVADAYICWGATDGGTSTGAWDNVVPIGTVDQGAPFSTVASGLTPVTTNYYSCYVVNEVGDAWSGVATFSTIADVTYVGPGNNSSDTWNTPSNWNPPAVPVSAMNPTIPENGYATAFSASTPTYTGDLVIGTNALLQLGWSTRDPAYYNALGTPGTTTITMHEGALINNRNDGNYDVPALVLAGNAEIRLGSSTQTPGDPDFAHGITGPYTLTFSGKGGNDVNLTVSNNFAALSTATDDRYWPGGFVIHAQAASSLPPVVTINPRSDGAPICQLSIETADAMPDTGVLNLNGDTTAALLTMGADDTIQSLSVNGVTMPSGTYGRVGTPAAVDYEMAWVTGDGALTVIGPGADTTAPVLVSITNAPASGSIYYSLTPATYTLTFDEAVTSGVTVADFANVGTAPATIDSVTQTDVNEFEVVVTPTAAGTLILRINASASFSDLPGNTLSGPITDTAEYAVLEYPPDPPIYEPFDYTPGQGLSGLDGGTGWGGAWAAPRNNPSIQEPNNIWGQLASKGHRMSPPSWSISYRPIGTTLQNAGLMADGATLWFSFVLDILNQNLTNLDFNYALCANNFVNDYPQKVNLLGNSEGIGIGNMTAGRILGAYWQDDGDADGYGERTLSATPLTLNSSDNSRALIVGKIEWGADAAAAEVLTLYAPGEDLAMPAPFLDAWATPALDQSVFDRVSIQWKDGQPSIDELRFGSTYEEVAATGIPGGPSASGTMIMIR